jgi:hypothetical protein
MSCSPRTDFFAELQLARAKFFLPVLTLPVHLHPEDVPSSAIQNESSPSSEILSNVSCSSKELSLLHDIGSTGMINFGGWASGRLFWECRRRVGLGLLSIYMYTMELSEVRPTMHSCAVFEGAENKPVMEGTVSVEMGSECRVKTEVSDEYVASSLPIPQIRSHVVQDETILPPSKTTT